MIGLDLWLLQTESDVARIDLTMIVYEPRRFDFLIAPPRGADLEKRRVMVPRP